MSLQEEKRQIFYLFKHRIQMKTYTHFYFNTKDMQEQIPQMYLTALRKKINQKCLLLCAILKERSVWLTICKWASSSLVWPLQYRKSDTLQEDFTSFQIWGTWSLIAGITTINHTSKSLNPACHFVVLLTCTNTHPHNIYVYVLSFTKPLVVGGGCPPSFSMWLFQRGKTLAWLLLSHQKGFYGNLNYLILLL